MLYRCLLLLGLSTMPGSVEAAPFASPLRFFEGATDSVGVLTITMREPRSSRSHGVGSIASDGSLRLVQHVDDEGERPHLRRWDIRQVAAGKFTGTMSEAVGPIIIEQIGTRYRFRFKMPGALSVEQWLTPLAGGRSAINELTVRKLGIVVARFRGLIRKAA